MQFNHFTITKISCKRCHVVIAELPGAHPPNHRIEDIHKQHRRHCKDEE